MIHKSYDRKTNEKSFTGNYRGVVINDLDPMEAGRVKIRVFGVHDELLEDDIPWAIFADPLMGGQPGLGGFITPDVGSHVWVFFEGGDHMQPVFFAGAPAKPHGPPEKTLDGVQYPRNKVFRTKAGHVIEIDDTPGDTRIHVLHKSGTHKTYHENGDAVEEITNNLSIYVEKDASIYVKGNVDETVEGNVKRQVQGDVEEIVNGDFTTTIFGRRKEQSGNGTEYLSSNNVTVSGSRIDLNPGGVAIRMVAGRFVYTAPYAYSYGSAKPLVEQAGVNAPFDTPDEQNVKEAELAYGEYPTEPTAPLPTETITTTDETVTEQSGECPVVNDPNDPYSIPLGNGTFTVNDLSLGAVFSHPLEAQNGLTVDDIVCNLHNLVLNCLDPISSNFPDLRINSGFRRGGGASQHLKGMAIDLQFSSGGTKDDYKRVLDFIAKNVPYDQCIIETSNGSTYWIHISFDKDKTTQRKERLTYVSGRSPAYTSGWEV